MRCCGVRAPRPGVGLATGKDYTPFVYGGDKEKAQNRLPVAPYEPDPTDSLFAGIGKSFIQGLTSFPRAFWGAGAMAEDIAKSIPQAIPLAAFTQIIPEDFFKHRYENVKGIEERFQAKGEGYKKYINGAIRTMSEMLSQYAGTAGLGTLPSMSAGAGIGKYLESRKEGYNIPRSFAAAGVTTATEYVTEKTPLEILGRPGLKFIDRLIKGLIADIPGEIEATLVEMTAVDQAILGKNYTRQEYLQALFDTAATAALTTLGATGVIHPFVVGTRSPASRTEQAQQTPEAQTAQQTPEIKQSAKEEVLGVKSEEYATAPKPQETETQQATVATFSTNEQVQDILNRYTEPVRNLELTPDNWKNEFGEDLTVETPIGKVKLGDNQYEKLVANKRGQYFGLIKPTLTNPLFVVKDKKGGTLFIKTFTNGKKKYFVSVGYDIEGLKVIVSSHPDKLKRIAGIIREGELLYKSTALDESASPSPKQPTVAGGLPDNTSQRTPVASDASSQTPSQKVAEKSPSQTSETFPGNPNDSIQPPLESVKPDIQLMPSLKDIVDAGKLSIDDALEIDNVARQNNWSEDTVKQFYKSAVEGLGIQNKGAASLEQALVAAKVKEIVYKQNAEKYRQELADNERLIKTLYDRLNIKIEGGAPDKYETIANNFIKNLGDLKKLKPEEIIEKAQKEFALNLNRLDTGMDVKTLITAAVQTINEAEDISRETVSHEQTVNEALKELPGIYGKVMGMKRGTVLTRPQQLAARMLGTALFEGFNKTRMLGIANLQDTTLYRQAQTQLIDLGRYWSKVLASSSEIGRMLEAQKIIEKVGADIPATEEFQKVLDMLSGQKEIPPEQFYQLTGMMKTPAQLSEMARELAKPASRRIQDVFLEAWINGLLSNPQTHATNVLSNLYTTFASVPERYLAAKLHYGDKAGVVDGEAKAMLYGMQMGFQDALNAARLAWATETGRFGKTATKVEDAKQKAITAENINRILSKFGVDPMNQTLSNAVDYIGKIWRLPARALITTDEFFKMINYRMELQSLAYRQAAMEGLAGDKAGARIAELIQKPTTEMRARAMAHANIQTFTGELGAVGRAVSSITERVPIAKIIVPFVRTPENIFTYAWERAPFLAYANKQIRADIKAGGAARDMALGKMAFGGMIASLAATLAASGFITGSGPEDRDLKKIMRDNGWQPNSIRIGDTYYSYKRMDPVGMIIGLIADTTEIIGSLDDYSAGKLAMSIVLSMEHNLLDNLYLDGIMNVLDAVQDPGKQWHDYFKKQAGSLIPAISGAIARGFDPVVHDTKTIVDTMRSRIPGFSVFAPAQRNIFGEKRLMEGSLGNDFISPIWQSRAKHDPVLEEIIKHQIDIHPPSRYIGGTAPAEIDPMAKDSPRAGVPLNPKQYERLQELTGQGLREALEKLIKKPIYQKQSDGPDGGKALLIRNVVERAREIGRQKLLKEDQQLYEQLKAKHRERKQVLQPTR
ncbi:MAG: hypothetical protein HRF42_08985 [Candidatus Brocadia sp.]|jgi:hypothetical protein